jgi:hypothetical protein
MKGTSFFILSVLSLVIIVLTLALVKPVAAENPIIVGKWHNTAGFPDVYTIYADGSATDTPNGNPHGGRWSEESGTMYGSSYEYIWYWDFAPNEESATFTDYIHVEDENHLSFVNNYGDRHTAARDAYDADSGFPIIPVAVGGGIATIAVVSVAVYYFFIAGGAKAAATAGGNSTSTLSQGSGEVAQNSSSAEDTQQTTLSEKDNYNMQMKNSDLSTSEKHNVKSQAQNQPAQSDDFNYPMNVDAPQSSPKKQPSDKPSEEAT